MSDQGVPSESNRTPQPTSALTDRVRQRVERATVALKRHDETASATPREPSTPPRAASPQGEPRTRGVRALRAVMRQLGEVHTQYRKRTGKRVSPPLRKAVNAFKQEPSLLSLLPVAAIVDDLELLTW